MESGISVAAIPAIPAGHLHDFQHFLLWEQASRDAILVKRVYIDVAGDLAAGVLLSQIIYWHLPNDEGRTRLRVEVDGYLWLVKGYDDWWDECRLTFKQARRAIDILQQKSLILTCNRKFGGAPRLHIRINREPFLEALNGFALQGKSFCPVGQNDLPTEANRPAPQGKSYKQRLQADSTAENTASAGSAKAVADFVPVGDGHLQTAAAAHLEEEEGNTSASTSAGTSAGTSTDTSALVEALIAADLNRSDAKRLAMEAPEEARRQLEYLPFKPGLDNPGGYLRSAIESGFPPPKEYKAAKAREERDRKKRESRAEMPRPASDSSPGVLDLLDIGEIPDPMQDVWKVALSHLKQIVNGPTLNAHLKPMRLASVTDTEAVLVAPTAFAKTWIEGHNRDAVEAALGEALGRPVSVRITTGGK